MRRGAAGGRRFGVGVELRSRGRGTRGAARDAAQCLVDANARGSRFFDEVFARFEAVFETAERVGVVAFETRALDTPEHIPEIEIARAGLEVHFVAVPVAVGKTHFADDAEVERFDE